ncbi:hypothetical protein U1Q18_023035, partial [Sarracenia purpurea var. burkii]
MLKCAGLYLLNGGALDSPDGVICSAKGESVLEKKLLDIPISEKNQLLEVPVE